MPRIRLAFLFAFVILAPRFGVTDEIEARFYLEKSQYLVGEPVYVAFEIVNNSSKDVIAYTTSGHQNCLGQATYQYEVEDAKPAGFGYDGCCGWPTPCVCDSLNVRLAPSQRYTERFILNFWYHLDKPGTYQARLKQDVLAKPPAPGVSTQREDFTEGSYHKFPISFELRVTLVQGSPAALMQAFQPVIRDLKSKDFLRLGWAQWAIIYLAPASLEPLIQRLAEIDPYGDNQHEMKLYGAQGVDGLARLNTPSARRRLAYLAEHDQRRDAIEALGRTGDRSHLPLLIRLCQNPDLRDAPAEAIGMLGGDEAIRFLVSQIGSPNAPERQAAASGLGHTGDRAAVRPLVVALSDPDDRVRFAAQHALGRLTHRMPGSDHGCGGIPPPPPSIPGVNSWQDLQAYIQAWWKANADRVTVFNWNDCGPMLPLD